MSISDDDEDDEEDALERRKDAFKRGPYMVCLLLESTQLVRVLNRVRASLKEAKLALNGVIRMTEKIAHVVVQILRDEIPDIWICGENRTKMSVDDWFANLLRRTHQLNAWATTLERPICAWLGGFHNPLAYLSATRRCVCRNAKLSMEQTHFVSHVTTYGANLFPSRYAYRGMYVSGLTLRGACWETKKKKKGLGASVLLHETIPCAGKLVRLGANTFNEDELQNELPALYFELCENVENKKNDEEGEDQIKKKKEAREDVLKNQYECPVFSTTSVSDADGFMSILLTASEDMHAEWIQSGVHAIL